MLPSSFPNREPVAKMTAKILFEIDAVHFRPDKPFMFTSGGDPLAWSGKHGGLTETSAWNNKE